MSDAPRDAGPGLLGRLMELASGRDPAVVPRLPSVFEPLRPIDASLGAGAGLADIEAFDVRRKSHWVARELATDYPGSHSTSANHRMIHDNYHDFVSGLRHDGHRRNGHDVSATADVDLRRAANLRPRERQPDESREGSRGSEARSLNVRSGDGNERVDTQLHASPRVPAADRPPALAQHDTPPATHRHPASTGNPSRRAGGLEDGALNDADGGPPAADKERRARRRRASKARTDNEDEPETFAAELALAERGGIRRNERASHPVLLPKDDPAFEVVPHEARRTNGGPAAAAAAAVINVTIGRVEVRAFTGENSSTRRSGTGQAPKRMSLDEYLARRAGER